MNDFTIEYIIKEIKKCTNLATKWPVLPRQELNPVLKKHLISKDYKPGLGQYPCTNTEEGIRRIGQWLFYEFQNRLDIVNPTICREAINRVAALVCTQIEEMSRLEIRSAIAAILLDIGFPPISESFRKHNNWIDQLAGEKINLVHSPCKEKNLAFWLQIMARANLLEIWPTQTVLQINTIMSNVFEPIHSSDDFSHLSQIIEKRLRKRVPVGLVTDNHGEIIIDLAFLSWLQTKFPTGVRYIFPKIKSVETDIDECDVSKNIAQFFPELKAQIVRNGSAVQGNLLTTASEEFLKTLMEIKNGKGLVIIKGLANFETMIGLKIDAVFLFAVKTPFIAKLMELEEGSLVGLRNCRQKYFLE